MFETIKFFFIHSIAFLYKRGDPLRGAEEGRDRSTGVVLGGRPWQRLPVRRRLLALCQVIKL
jgi:hypothetical protein